MNDWDRPAQPAQEEGGASASEADLVCPWCSTGAAPGTIRCPGCGAAMAQRDSLGDVVVPGVTHADSEIPPPSLTRSLVRTQTTMGTLNALGQAGGVTVQLAAAAAILAKGEIGGILGGGPAPDPASIGRTSQAALDMAERLDQVKELPAGADANVSADAAGSAPEEEPPASDPWRDLPVRDKPEPQE